MDTPQGGRVGGQSLTEGTKATAVKDKCILRLLRAP